MVMLLLFSGYQAASFKAHRAWQQALKIATERTDLIPPQTQHCRRTNHCRTVGMGRRARPVYEDQDMNARPGMSRAQSGVFWYHLSSTAILLALPSVAPSQAVSEAAQPLPSAPSVAAVGASAVSGRWGVLS
jgi:hypothetical protein